MSMLSYLSSSEDFRRVTASKRLVVSCEVGLAKDAHQMVNS